MYTDPELKALGTQKLTETEMSKGGTSPNGHQLVNGHTKCGKCIQWNITQPQNKQMKF